jgi:DNA ligase-1
MSTKSLAEFYTLRDTLRLTNSQTEKKQILRANLSDFLLRVLLYTYHPFYTYGVSLKASMKVFVTGSEKEAFSRYGSLSSFFELLDELRSRRLTGRKAQIAVRLCFDNLGPIIEWVLDKDLGCGINVKAINSVRPGLVPEFRVALGYPYEHEPIDFENEAWYASRKLDGVRCLLAVSKDKYPSAVSRSGKPFTTVGHLEEALSFCRHNIVLDGELCVINDDGAEDFLSCVSLVRRKSGVADKVCLSIFDMLTLKEFATACSTLTFSERQERLRLFIKELPPLFRLVRQIRVKNQAHLDRLYAGALEREWEGLVLRKDSLYQGKRTRDILKLKLMKEAEFVIVGYELGEMFIPSLGKECPVLKSVFVELDGNKVKVGGGWSQEERMDWYCHPKGLVGQEITVQYFDESITEKGRSLRFPVKKVLHGKKRTL